MTTTRSISLFCLSFLMAAGLAAQPTTDANRKKTTAVRVSEAPRLDGELDDPCWQEAPVAGDFVTFAPVFGQPAAEKTTIRIVYTDEAIYVGGYCYMKDGSLLRKDLGVRDALGPSDQLHIGFDTYRDRQNAFRFEISAAGVQRDSRMSPDNFDPSWDAVWDAKVKAHQDGWSVEFKIPFSAIRFPKKAEQVWGLQVARQIQYLNEFSTWSPVDPNGGGTMPQWGDLEGLKDLDPPLRLAFSPYVATSVQRSPLGTDPVTYANSKSINGGMDVKWGINESFTLDATLIPNFGEAQSDNVVRNLSPFEIQYEERRQFFTEGTELFSKGNIFYSRRIGGTPQGFNGAINSLQPGEQMLKNPSQQPLYNATKLSGRTKSKLGIGVLNAVARPTEAVIRQADGSERTFQTAPLTNYNVLIIDQLLPNNSAVGFTNTSVLREGGARDANVSAITWTLRDKKNKYEFGGLGNLSQVFDQGVKTTGTRYAVALRQVSGKYSWELSQTAADDRYDQRDLALNRRNNYIRQLFSLSRGNYTEHGNFLYTYWQFSAENSILNFPRKWESLELTGVFDARAKNQLGWSGVIVSRPLWHYDFFEPRVWGKQYYHAPWVFVQPQLTTDTRKKLYCTFEVTYGESPIPNDPYVGVGLQPVWIASPHLQLRGVFKVSKDHSNFGAVNWSNPADVVFGRRNITTFNNEITTQYLFGPRMSLSARVRHYWANLYYHEYLHLQDDGTFLPYPEYQGSADENFNLFNVDFVYTWQFAPGSFLNLIWKDAGSEYDNQRGGRFVPNFRKTVDSPQDNTLTLKLIYWLDAGNW